MIDTLKELPTFDELIKSEETKYAQKAMIVGDMSYKIQCLYSEMAQINQQIINLKNPQGEPNGEKV